jgi:hypothetical protein
MSDEVLRQWVETGARTGLELDAIHRRELEALTDDDVRRIIQNLFSLPLPENHPPRLDSGLVEQQRWFARLRKRG